MMKFIIGIDVGGSTTKIVGYNKKCELINVLCVTAKDPVTSVYGALGRFLSENNIELNNICKIILTGVGASKFSGDIYGISTSYASEFEAIGLGGLELSQKESAIVVSVGTGTAFVRADKNNIKHLGGSGVGGGTLVGLCSKLINTENFDTILQFAKDGDLAKVDLTVGDISKKEIENLPSDMTAANFGKIDDDACNSDLVLGTLNLIFQTIGMLCVFACINDEITDVVITGMLTNVPQINDVLARIEEMHNIKFIIPEKAMYSTAIGAALTYILKK